MQVIKHVYKDEAPNYQFLEVVNCAFVNDSDDEEITYYKFFQNVLYHQIVDLSLILYEYESCTT